MRKIMKAAVAVVGVPLLLAPAACGSSSSGGASTGSGSGNLSGKTVQLIVGVKDDPFYITMTCGAQAEAQKEGVKFSANGSAQWDVSQQRPIIHAGAATKPARPPLSPGRHRPPTP